MSVPRLRLNAATAAISADSSGCARPFARDRPNPAAGGVHADDTLVAGVRPSGGVVVWAGGEGPGARVRHGGPAAGVRRPPPLVLAGRTANRIDALPVAPHRYKRGGLIADIALDIRV